MRIALISEYNAFTTTGGTEYYTSMLANGLVQQGHEILFISRGAQESAPDEQVIQIAQSSYRLLLLPAEQYDAAEIQQRILSRTWRFIFPALNTFQPDIVHIHTFSTFFNIRHLEETDKFFANVVFTAHVGGHFCLAEWFIRNQSAPCNGKIGLQCKVCLFHYSFKRGFSNLIHSHSENRLRIIQSMVSRRIQFVCVSEWQRQQMLVNGYPGEMLSVIRQALVVGEQKIAAKKSSIRNGRLRVGYLGRLSPEKGSRLLLSLIEQMVNSQQTQFVLGIPNNSNNGDLLRLRKLQENHPDLVQILMNVASAEKESFFAQIDVLLIPSFFMETGPIVLLEAICHGTMVLAPDAGSPVEFGAEFPELIRFYKWNNATDIMNVLGSLQGEHFVGDFRYSDSFTSMQQRFIEQHLQLYTKIFISNRN